VLAKFYNQRDATVSCSAEPRKAGHGFSTKSIFFLGTGELRGVLALEKVRDIMRAHLEDLYALYGDATGVRVARKHLSWYFRQHPGQEALRNRLVTMETPGEQLATLLQHFDTGMHRAA
jgi:tRNA-dihydrouridine synthase